MAAFEGFTQLIPRPFEDDGSVLFSISEEALVKVLLDALFARADALSVEISDSDKEGLATFIKDSTAMPTSQHEMDAKLNSMNEMMKEQLQEMITVVSKKAALAKTNPLDWKGSSLVQASSIVTAVQTEIERLRVPTPSSSSVAHHMSNITTATTNHHLSHLCLYVQQISPSPSRGDSFRVPVFVHFEKEGIGRFGNAWGRYFFFFVWYSFFFF